MVDDARGAMRAYANGEIRVIWRPDLCAHSGVCVRGLAEVFRPRERPWIDLGGAASDRIATQVEQCPSGDGERADDRTAQARALEGTRERWQGSAGGDRAVIDQLPGEAALEIGHRRPAEKATQNDGQPGPLVQMTVDHGGPEAPGGRDQEQQIEAGLVDRKADRRLAHPRKPNGPHGANGRDVPPLIRGLVSAEGIVLAEIFNGMNVSRQRASSIRRVTQKTSANLTRCWIRREVRDHSHGGSPWFGGKW